MIHGPKMAAYVYRGRAAESITNNIPAHAMHIHVHIIFFIVRLTYWIEVVW